MKDQKRKTKEEFERDFNLIVKDTGANINDKDMKESTPYFKKFSLYNNDSKCVTSNNL